MEGLNGKSPISSLLLGGFPQLVMTSSFNGKTYLQEGGKPPFIGCQWQRLTRQRGKLGHQQQLLAAPSFSHIKLPNLITFSSLFFHAIIVLHEPLNQAHFIFSFNIIFFPAPSQLVFFVIGSFFFYPIFFLLLGPPPFISSQLLDQPNPAPGWNRNRLHLHFKLVE